MVGVGGGEVGEDEGGFEGEEGGELCMGEILVIGMNNASNECSGSAFL